MPPVVLASSTCTQAGAATPDVDAAGMHYFRASSARDCNVYMNYSFYDPHFQLIARNPAALTAAERGFIAQFNQQFQAVAAAMAAECRVPAGGAGSLNSTSGPALYRKCQAADERLGISEGGWVGGRLPAPSNCISRKLSSAGTVEMIRGPLPDVPMSLAAWLARARGDQ